MPYKDPARQRKYHRDRRARRRAEFFNNKVCIDCGDSDDLELDHVDPKLKISHTIWSWSDVKLSAELAKCVVRCHYCHWLKGQSRNEVHAHNHIRRCQECGKETGVGPMARHQRSTGHLGTDDLGIRQY